MRIARYDGVTWKSVGNGFAGGLATVNDMEIYQGELYVAGIFKKNNGNPDNNIASWDGQQWHEVGGGVAPLSSGTAQIFDLHIFNNELYAVGEFSYAGGVPAKNIAIWDGEKWCGLGSYFDNTINVSTFYQNELYVGGAFWTIDGDSTMRIAKWIGGDYVDTCGSLTGVDEFEISNSNIRVYPNPANKILTIEMVKPIESIYIIYNITGQLLQTGSLIQKVNIDVGEFAEGVYVIQLQTEFGDVRKKFVKQ